MRLIYGGYNDWTYGFQSTHPVRGATGYLRGIEFLRFEFQSTHPVRGATAETFDPDCVFEISIHAPREGCDSLNLIAPNAQAFQSTHPVRGATIALTETAYVPPLFQSTHPVRGATR